MSLVSKINALAQGIAADIKALAAGTGIALLAGGGLASNASGLQLDTAVAVRKVTKPLVMGRQQPSRCCIASVPDLLPCRYLM
jgi:hypothetical protein